MSDSTSDVIVIGGGVIGLSCALYLLKAGASVRVIERAQVGAGASHGNCGTITPSHIAPITAPGAVGRALRSLWRRDAPLHVSPWPDPARFAWLAGMTKFCNWAEFSRIAEARSALLQRSRTVLDELLEIEQIDAGMQRTGTLYVYRDGRQLQSEQWHAEWLQRLGTAVQVLDGDELAAMEPALADGVAGGFFHPDDASLRPEKLVAGLAERVRVLGGHIEERMPVRHLQTRSRAITRVDTKRGRFRAERVVLAAGAWSPKLARQLGLHLPMQPGKGYSLTFSPSSQMPQRPLSLREASVCVTGWSDGLRLGSTMEFSGYDKRMNTRRLEAIRRAAATYLKVSEGPELTERWWGWRPMVQDELPLIGPSARWSNLMLATGHGMLGMSMAAATAELVAGLCAGPAPLLDPSPYAPSRFGL
ncbi:FAD-dependent oxidoreductase [Oleiagrimonas sp. C23AA]|uniref:NAD(P)/FAD-dependent oxidoreductase n=1 Tax=Oleiagrimonas sp. C23AA TaxID=2719047 RepID=UPI00141DB942|nr:FAD-dependent oxidoreductase [Oleiagrimonas sp. C23AA]NII09322.1 FAD-dependent oxidoreductase [Oleiagrimonas sp. C23AA]